MTRGASFEPPSRRCTAFARRPHLIRIGAIMRLSAHQQTMDARVAPLLWRSTRAMTRAPCSQPAIIRRLQILYGHTGRRRLLRQAPCIRKQATELHCIRTCFALSVFIGFESFVSARIPPIHFPVFQDLFATLRCLLPRQPRIILVWPQRIVLFEFSCASRHPYFPTIN